MRPNPADFDNDIDFWVAQRAHESRVAHLKAHRQRSAQQARDFESAWAERQAAAARKPQQAAA